ncbi:hypothetical protein [Flavobacterium columnare]|uniref:Uncharacterized protein n=1 Tax=Flavobacterium columnare (strain ATCC 49512 / CIP 103533 / TG 44/87) TaxID=1041826 RepID=G8XA84_FLACA|nr:hypothetical protein [Flavobacterium columnare]AEW85942.1 hypothetical protein FCOL_05585 [Flavobacterium columnare ATCC 49512]
MALFHLLFELIKISILSCIYASLTLLVFKIIANYKPNSWFDRVSKKKLKLWFSSGLCISIFLFFFMFSHFGDHGLGDSARIPIGHGKAIQEVDGMQAYIQDEGPISMIEIDRFIIADDFVYGFISEGNENYEGSYFVYDLVNNSVKTFEEENDYINLLKTKKLDYNTDYKDFGYYYGQYWHGWRFWLLP